MPDVTLGASLDGGVVVDAGTVTAPRRTSANMLGLE